MTVDDIRRLALALPEIAAGDGLGQRRPGAPEGRPPAVVSQFESDTIDKLGAERRGGLSSATWPTHITKRW